MSLTFYKLIHLIGLFFLFAVAGGVALYSANGGTRDRNAHRKLTGALLGIALVLLLVSGFGQLARLGIKHDWLFPGWIWVKLVLFVALGWLATLPYRKPGLGKLFLWLLPLLGAVAGWMALFKPF